MCYFVLLTGPQHPPMSQSPSRSVTNEISALFRSVFGPVRTPTPSQSLELIYAQFCSFFPPLVCISHQCVFSLSSKHVSCSPSLSLRISHQRQFGLVLKHSHTKRPPYRTPTPSHSSRSATSSISALFRSTSLPPSHVLSRTCSLQNHHTLPVASPPQDQSPMSFPPCFEAFSH